MVVSFAPTGAAVATVLFLLVVVSSCSAFAPPSSSLSSWGAVSASARGSSARKLSDNDDINSEKTYGQTVAPIKDMIDSEAAMNEFFSSNEEWAPLFRSVAHHSSVPAMSFLKSKDDTSDTVPWKVLDAIPTIEEDRQVVAAFLDSMHQSLVDIPVTEGVAEDENDLHFLEEGRRILAISRFQVLREIKGGSVENHDSLFATCWSEIMELRRRDECDTGSLILLPQYNIADLRRFADINLIRPLEWLGIKSYFEVASIQRGSPAIRMIHKLSDMPTDVPNEPILLRDLLQQDQDDEQEDEEKDNDKQDD